MGDGTHSECLLRIRINTFQRRLKRIPTVSSGEDRSDATLSGDVHGRPQFLQLVDKEFLQLVDKGGERASGFGHRYTSGMPRPTNQPTPRS